MKTSQRTVLHELHRRLGARMTEFAGFEMPVRYAGIIKEHLAVRTAAGVFDLSHMGEFEVNGAHAIELLERALTNSAAQLREGQAQYSLMCASDGGTIDDLIVYRLSAQRYLLCVNAANTAVDWGWLVELNRRRATLTDVSGETTLVGVQGPKAIAILQGLSKAPIQRIARFGLATIEIAGVDCLAARTGYTGEDGLELFVQSERARPLFEAILEAGRGRGLEPCGLGARDTLRLEAGLPLYGHELDRSTSPLEAGLGAFVKLGRDFVGAQALARQQAEGLKKRLIGLRTDDGKSIPRQGYKLFDHSHNVGTVTSGTFAPSLNRPLAMAYVGNGTNAPTRPGIPLDVEIRGNRVPATVVPLPFYLRKR